MKSVLRFHDRMSSAINQMLPYMAWASMIFSLVGGALLPGTPVGKSLTSAIESFAWPWVPPVAFAGAIVGIILDTGRDLLPDRIAVYSAMIAPTAAGAVGGKLAEHVIALAQWLTDHTIGWLREWSNIPTDGGIAALCLVCAVVVAKRVVKDRKASG